MFGRMKNCKPTVSVEKNRETINGICHMNLSWYGVDHLVDYCDAAAAAVAVAAVSHGDRFDRTFDPYADARRVNAFCPVTMSLTIFSVYRID